MPEPIRSIFTLSIVGMWVLFGIGLAAGSWTTQQWLMLAAAHAGCAIVFVNFAYLFSYGYAFSMVLVHVTLLVLMPSPAAALVCGLAIAYGLRLWWFVHVRYQGTSYSQIRARGDKADAAMPLPARLFLWVAVSWLMAFEGMVAWRVATTATLGSWVLAGAALMAAGLLLETVADAQKQSVKNRDPAAFAADGLYRYVRHPNYLGEIIFQFGLMLAWLGQSTGWYDYALCLIAPAYITVLMIWAARNADAQQLEKYAQDSGYAEYRARTGCLLPGL